MVLHPLRHFLLILWRHLLQHRSPGIPMRHLQSAPRHPPLQLRFQMISMNWRRLHLLPHRNSPNRHPRQCRRLNLPDSNPSHRNCGNRCFRNRNRLLPKVGHPFQVLHLQPPVPIPFLKESILHSRILPDRQSRRTRYPYHPELLRRRRTEKDILLLLNLCQSADRCLFACYILP